MKKTSWEKIEEAFVRALELSEKQRAAYLAALADRDPALQSEVDSLLRARDAAGDFLVAPAVSCVSDREGLFDPLVGKEIGSYRVDRRVATGGMGAVYLGRRIDDEYETEVAIKIIQPERIGEAALKRFFLERQILSDLKHPNIAHLLDGGRTGEGLPYYVMELIDGVSIVRHCNEERLSIEDRLALFLEVCDAVEFAHRNFVVHRDLKPENILVDREGRPKLLDFGIAKILSEEPTVTIDATHLQNFFTPNYASPEQVRGQKITIATDVYGLGGILYELLSGKTPYELETRRAAEIECTICEVNPVAPSLRLLREYASPEGRAEFMQSWPPHRSFGELVQAVRGDLDTIVLKALRKEPERRYATAAELSADIQNYLKGMPVGAHPDSFRYRTGKFVRRNRGAVFAALALLLTLAGGLVLSTWQAQIAARERGRAETRFNQVRTLATTLIHEIYDGIEKLPGSTSLRQNVVSHALEYLDSLSSEAAGDLELQKELAAAYDRIGDVQGNPNGANLGDLKGALTSYRKARVIREELLRRSPQDEELLRDLAQTSRRIGDVLWWSSDTEGALENFEQALRIFPEPAAEEADAILRSEILNAIGDVHAWNGESAEAIRRYDESIRLLSSAGFGGEGLSSSLLLSETFRKKGDALAWADQLEAALLHIRKAIGILEPLLQDNGENTAVRKAMAVALIKLGENLEYLEEMPHALDSYREALRLFRKMIAADERDVQSARYESICLAKIGDVQIAQGRPREALSSFKEALLIQQRLKNESPGNFTLEEDIANSEERIGVALLRSGDFEAARRQFEALVRTRRELIRKDPENSRTSRNLAVSLHYLANACLEGSRQPPLSAPEGLRLQVTARDSLEESLEIWNTLEERGQFHDWDLREKQATETALASLRRETLEQ